MLLLIPIPVFYAMGVAVVAIFSVALIKKLYKEAPQKILVLGLNQSGKTTLHNSLRGKGIKESYCQTPNCCDLEEFEMEYKGTKIKFGKSKDIPGDLNNQIAALNKNVKEFFKNEESGLIIYLVNCNDIDKPELIEHAGRVLGRAFEFFSKANVAIIYSHPDEVGKTKKDLADIRNNLFLNRLSTRYPTLAERLRESELHYMANLTEKEQSQEVMIEIFQKIKK